MKFPLLVTAGFAFGAFAVAQTKPKPPVKPVPAPAEVPTETPAAERVAPEGDGPEKAIARFFGFLQRRDVDQAYESLTKGTKIADRPDDVRMLKSKTNDAIKAFGIMTGHDQIGKKAVGERLLCYTYVSLGKDFPLRWRFYFYKPQDTWKLIDLRVDDRLAAIFEEPEEQRPRE